MDDPRWRRYWRFLTVRFRGEVGDELAFHVEMRTAELVRQGLSPEAARREAERRFGDRHRVQSRLEHIERKRGGRVAIGFAVEELWQDIRYGARGLLKQPGFTVLTASSLAVGIAAVTVALTIVDSWLLRPLPVPKPNELVIVGTTTKATGSLVYPGISLRTIRDLAARKDLFQDVSGFQIWMGAARPANSDRGEVQVALLTTGSYFSTLGISPALGRLYSTADEDRREHVVVLAHQFWKTRFGAAPSAIGATVYFNRVPFTVIGVAPPGFGGTEQILAAAAFLPAATAEVAIKPAAGRDLEQRAGYYQVVARRQRERTVGAIQSALDLLAKQLYQQFPELGEGYQFVAMPETRARPSMTTGMYAQAGSLAFFGLTALVLVAACINAANLILVRNTTRQTELTLRRALGASPVRVVRQLATESVLLAGLGFAAAWFLAKVAIEWFRALPMPQGLPVTLVLDFDARTFGLAGIVTLVAGLIAGLGPAIVGARVDLARGLKEGGRGGAGRGRARGRAALVVAQVAAATVVLICAGLFRSNSRAAAQLDLGMKPDNVLAIGVDATVANYDEPTARRAFERIEAAVRQLPGVRAAAWSTQVPLSAIFKGTPQDIYPDNPAAGTSKTGTLWTFTAAVEPEYFDILRIPILQGRAFTPADDSAGARVVIVNQHLANQLWPGSSPIGRSLRFGKDGTLAQVVGVAKNGRYLYIGEAPQPYAYLPLTQRYVPQAAFLVHTSGDPTAVMPAVRQTFAAIDKDLIPQSSTTMRDLMDGMNGLLVFRLGATIAATVGSLAVVLTIVGLYGVIAYSVSQRTREIGVRLALGADRRRVVGGILKQGTVLAGAGITIGVVLALGVTRLLAGLLVGVSATDLTVFGTVVIGLVLVALGSAYIPARRAARLDPVRALRADG